MPGYIKKQLQKYQHEISQRLQNSPYPSAPKKYGTAEQEPLQPYDSNPASPKVIIRVQKIFFRILYYVLSVDPKNLMSLSTLASEKYKATTETITDLHQHLDYLGTHIDAKIRYSASDIILNVH